MKHLKFLGWIIVVLIVVILIVENQETFSTKVIFKINFFSYHYQSVEISLYYIVTIAFLFGILVAGLYGILERYQLLKEIKRIKRDSKEKEEELNSLRNLPITSENVGTGDI